MLLPRSAQTASLKPRERLFPWWTMALFGLGIAGALLLFFPQRWLLSQVEQTHPGDRLSTEYLEALIRSQPGDTALRLALARQYLAARQWPAADRTLQPLLDASDPEPRSAARLLAFDSLAGQLAATQEGAGERASLLQQLWQLARHSALTSSRWLTLANLAEGQQQAGIAEFAFRKLTEIHPDQALLWLERSAVLQLAQGHYQSAADRYFRAMQQAQGRSRQRHFFLQGMRSLQSGNLLPEALASARRYGGPLRDDRDTLVFLIQLCRAAGDLNEAERYARRLLKMSLWQELQRALALQQALPADTDHWQTVTATGPLAPFDEEAYRLGFDVLLANRKLQDAQQVAERAVSQQPDDLSWRKRLAQVAEWNQQPALALQHWLLLARRGGSHEAWQAVLRLAPGLHDDDALLAAWQHQAERGALTEVQWRLLVDLYERNGEPLAAARYLLQRHRTRPQAMLLELAGDLLQRSGEDEQAIAAFQQLARDNGLTPELALKIATLQYSLGGLADAHATLRRAQPLAEHAPDSYWRTLARLAWQLQDRHTAVSAYRRLIDRQGYTRADLEQLINTLESDQPASAALLAERLHREFGSPRHILLALLLHGQLGQWPAAARLLAGLDPATRQALAAEPAFWSISAQIHHQSGQQSQALAAAEQALALTPADPANRQALLWLLIDYRRHGALRRQLLAWLPDARQDPGYRESYAAGWLSLGEARKALPWFTALTSSKHSDPLWLMNYADALEQAVEPDLAWRIRRHLWQGLLDQPARRPDLPLVQQARLALQFAPSGHSAGIMRQLLRQDTASGPATPEGAQAAELTLAWALSTEQDHAARAWLLTRYAAQQQRPHWAELSLALQAHDTPQLQRLLDGPLSTLPVNDAIEAARLLKRNGQATQLAFDRLDTLDHDAATHAQLAETVLAQTSQIAIRLDQQRMGGVRHAGQVLAMTTAITPALRFSLELGQRQQSLRAGGPFPLPPDPLPDLNPAIPARLTHWQADWHLQDATGSTRVTLGQRNPAQPLTSLLLSRELRIDRMLDLQLSAAANQPVEYSDRLWALGNKHLVQAGLRFKPDRLDYFSLSWRQEQLSSLMRADLGRARILQWELGQRFRTEYPDWTLRLSGYSNRFRPQPFDFARLASNLPTALPDDELDRWLLPTDSSAIGLNIGFGQQYADDYTRAMRPYGDIGVSRSRNADLGYNWLLGIAGSVTGTDHLSAWFSGSRTRNSITPDSSTIGLTYTLNY